ncbi:serine threonine protein kinase : Nuclease-like protein,protein kinase family protein OS=Singulisphaera acidiphila (strain ATCC BAA-1392 / DSM 18658 / VKM B-2454 / MOB10) GN=Sinac_1959 PE=4 SV=1: NERD: Pkinase: Pkinase: RNA_pol_A_CTD [Gemmataceae bacterium]|nr:serine threonine protein kinase : Nuclease-like protein,protein kinase family protein OS=Singulisphaera acidiphila (strain ATCC BAA-1392 / DSM 18658 / VKM B-2454 / MOB10) GN=Sinac_1959 PE=4 SV=1: NERD: Pkinase: Pkinase: RNA_pol_A_CTD [Gemmataceae bacterium]VTU01485.1 serine threonine protein kinase : Nuclease-like protein,protein kinase family protein OS=Singulisphaera acidiphila (strain ATCC BAA-1392 / DSM 18658 / VKM B-2454 / MOB10) GN=Sinac_1959 PE=4 SV=1: NERD: Pkinase: Pkinase: RNA_pol_A_C
MDAPRWNIITPSQYEWERRGLDFIRAGLPDHDPYRAWANFEFQTADGAIYEVDLLVLTKMGFWLVECKAWPGHIGGDPGTWTRSHEGKVRTEDNPVLLANRKAKALASLLKVQPALGKLRLPWLDAIVFLSAEGVQCGLTGTARNRVLLRDRPKTDTRPDQKGVLAALINREGPGIDADLRGTIDIKVAKGLSRAMEQAGVRPSQRARRVGDYILGDLIFDGPGYQDRLAKHASFDSVYCRVRQYTVAQASSEDDRRRLKRAAAREFQIIQTLDHQNVLPVLDYKEHENGPALLFRYLDPNAVRFDHFLAAHGQKLEAGQRLDLLRQLADAIRYAHRKRVIHRSLGPQSILVSDADSSSPRLQVYNWQVGVRESTSTSGRVTNVEDLVEAQSLVYMSPEALSDSRKVTEASDVFSLGAIAYHLFANRPPASNPTELARVLRDQKGLSVSAVLDGAGPKLEELIQWSTHPDVLTRIGSVEDFLVLLGDVEDELTAPKETVVNDPLQAKQGDRLPQGFVVKRELGQGATAKALLVVKDEKESVLKVALTEDDNARLHEEADALRSIHSEFIVAIEQELTMGGRTVLALQKAGDHTLAAVLAKDGVPGLELLSRYGDDLLSALCSLERHGVVHRDIKPDNIGIRSLTKQRNQLILFDFSLARAPLDHIHVGTEGYRDPFLKLRKPARWDLAAERYSAAVTLYEMTLGHGVLPQWGSDKSDPALTNDKLVIDAEKFDPSVRDGLVEFFSTALHREPAERYDSAYDMQTAWRQVFTEAEQRKIVTASGDEIVLGVSLEQATLGTPVSALGLSTRARNALERANAVTVRDLLNFPVGDIHLMKGVGNQTRQEIIRFVVQLRGKFPNVEPIKPKDQPADDDTAGPPSLEALHHRIVGVRNPKKDGEWNVRSGLLGLSAPDSQPPGAWPSQTDVAEALGITRARVGQVVSTERTRWGKDAQITAFRHELCEQIQRLGGVVTIAEIIDLTLLLRPAASTPDAARQQRLASAVARAVVETEDMMPQRRFQMRRVAGKVVIACSQELAVYAEKLGQVADQLARADPLASPIRVFQELYEVQQPSQPHGCQPFGNERLLNLAAAMSQKAAVSSRQEVYPRGMAAERALRLGIGALSGLGIGDTEKGFSVEQVRERVKSRYPAAEPLPDRPDLDALLHKVGLDVRWDADSKLYQRREATTLVTSGSSVPRRRSTATTARQVEVTPDVADARAFEERLKHAHGDGGFLVLTVRPSRMRWAEAELLRRFDLERVSFDDLFFDVLRDEAKELEVDWAVIEQADGADPTSQDWKNLLHLIGRAGPKIASRLADRRDHLLLVHPGLIARYDLMAVLETLRDRVGHDAPCPGLWLLVATDGQNEMPVLDNAEIPLITPGQRARVSESWLENLHRGRSEQSTVPAAAGKKVGNLT